MKTLYCVVTTTQASLTAASIDLEQPFIKFSLWLTLWVLIGMYILCDQDSGIDVGQGINVGPWKFVKNNKHRVLI